MISASKKFKLCALIKFYVKLWYFDEFFSSNSFLKWIICFLIDNLSQDYDVLKGRRLKKQVQRCNTDCYTCMSQILLIEKVKKNYPWVFHTVLPSISIVNTDWHVIDFFTNVSEFVFQKYVILNVKMFLNCWRLPETLPCRHSSSS